MTVKPKLYKVTVAFIDYMVTDRGMPSKEDVQDIVNQIPHPVVTVKRVYRTDTISKSLANEIPYIPYADDWVKDWGGYTTKELKKMQPMRSPQIKRKRK